MTLPRALFGPAMAMARPRRPASEARAVREAADMVRADTGLTSAKALGREVAARVTAALLDDTRNDSTAILSGIVGSDPVAMLAFTQDSAASDELAERFRDRMLANFGISISAPFQQEVQRRDAAHELGQILAARYARHLSPVTNLG